MSSVPARLATRPWLGVSPPAQRPFCFVTPRGEMGGCVRPLTISSHPHQSPLPDTIPDLMILLLGGGVGGTRGDKMEQSDTDLLDIRTSLTATLGAISEPGAQLRPSGKGFPLAPARSRCAAQGVRGVGAAVPRDPCGT
ncbi:hypothetical protein chiPu_0025417 [Chiloscyllium punctatum]|uniref:Uncharacterized protein n=1 Tax=Chiloscyllium punctatum TaxID=137246 RepID=A0A401TF79_CHIPU|nr:hypothetical protein [Chiloscyllium punctatum]